MTYLEVDYDEDYDNGGDQVADIGRVLTVESLLDSVELVLFGEQEVEKGDDSSFKLSTLFSSNCDRGERFP